LTDIAKYRNADDPRFVIQNWMRTRFTVDFLGIWEQLNNPAFNRVEFGAVKNESGRRWSKKLLQSKSPAFELPKATGLELVRLANTNFRG
jgi:hypothetical protein